MTASRAVFRSRVLGREELLGSFVLELPTRAAIECYALAGFDFLVLDLEHSDTDMSRLSLLVAVCRAAGIASVVRIEADALHQLTRVLDMAPDGVMVPGVRSALQAAEVISAARYHPSGHRGLAPLVRHAFQADPDEGVAGRDRVTVVAVQLEAAEALPEAADVAATPGIDVVFVGPYDLSQSVGRPGELDHPEVQRAGAELAAHVVEHSTLGVYIERPEQSALWRERGASFFTLRSDGRIFLDGCRETLTRWREPE